MVSGYVFPERISGKIDEDEGIGAGVGVDMVAGAGVGMGVGAGACEKTGSVADTSKAITRILRILITSVTDLLLNYPWTTHFPPPRKRRAAGLEEYPEFSAL
jgi:hypothetical protein